MRINDKDVQQIEAVMRILQGKWAIDILWAMRDGPVRLGQLRRLIPQASKKALTARLRGLEELGIILRRDLSGSVLHVEYQLREGVREPLILLLRYLADCPLLLLRPIPNQNHNLRLCEES